MVSQRPPSNATEVPAVPDVTDPAHFNPKLKSMAELSFRVIR